MPNETSESKTTPRCLDCGYTEADAKRHMDHHLCKGNKYAPWVIRNENARRMRNGTPKLSEMLDD